MALELNGTTGVSLVQDGVVVAADLNSALSDTIGKVKAWVNFNGTGTVAIRASYGVSSISDNGTGNYNINFTTAFANTDYAVVGSCEYRTTLQTDQTTRSTSSVNVVMSVGASGSSVVGHTDKAIVAVAVFN